MPGKVPLIESYLPVEVLTTGGWPLGRTVVQRLGSCGKCRLLPPQTGTKALRVLEVSIKTIQ